MLSTRRYPEWLFNLSGLKRLDLYSNNLYGLLPHALANSTLLEELNLSENFGIEGKLTRKLGKLCNLKTLVLNGNKFEGGVIEFIDGLSELMFEQQVGDIGFGIQSTQWEPSRINLKNLRYLRLLHNSFRGSIPETIGNLSPLREFYLSDNQMSGIIPASFGQLVSLEAVDLSENTWEGVITEAHLTNLSRLLA